MATTRETTNEKKEATTTTTTTTTNTNMAHKRQASQTKQLMHREYLNDDISNAWWQVRFAKSDVGANPGKPDSTDQE
jgi:hypothetical protein